MASLTDTETAIDIDDHDITTVHVEAPSPFSWHTAITPRRPSSAPAGHNDYAEQKRSLLKNSLVISIGATCGILIPPLSEVAKAGTTKFFSILLKTYWAASYASLGIAALEILAAMVVHRIPQILPASNMLKIGGLALIRFTLGFGASLVLLAVAPPWFVLYVIFHSLKFM